MNLPSGTVTFLFTDIQGSTVRWERYREAMRVAVQRHDALVREAVQTHGGVVFKTVGDELCAAFSNALDAIAAALAAQRGLHAADFSAVGGLSSRMGIHAGTVQASDGDYLGPPLNRVARLMALAHGEQIVLSRVVADLVDGELPPDTSLRDLGPHRLEGIASAEQVYQLVAPDLRSGFPPLRAGGATPGNLPVSVASLVGRSAEVAEIEQLLDASRLITIVGSGGVGKSSIALHVAREKRSQYRDGAWIVELAQLADETPLAGTIAAALGIDLAASPEQRPPIEELALAVSRREMLIVLDNCEHLIAGVARAVERILRICPDVRILATSRERLSIDGEQTYDLPTLSTNDGVALFVERARGANVRFELTDTNVSDVKEIVRRLDGIPLAIELAAARERLLGCTRIARSLNDRFTLLAGGSRTAAPRQQTLRAMIAWSYDLLSEPEQSMLQQLAVFRSGWTLDAAQFVCTDERFEDWDAIALLASLLDKSLVLEERLESQSRYRMFESTAAFALERLEESGRRDAVAARFCRWFCRESEALYDAWYRTNEHDWNALLQRDIDNFRTAIDWALTRGNDVESGVRIVVGLSACRIAEMNELVEDAGRYSNGIGERTQALLELAQARTALLRHAGSAQSAAETFRRIGERGSEAEALMHCGGEQWRRGNAEDALRRLREALDVAERFAPPRQVADVLNRLGALTAVATPRRTEGREMVERAVAMYESVDDRGRLVWALVNLAELLFEDGDAAGALERADQALGLARGVGNEYAAIQCQNNLASYAMRSGRIRAAASHVRDALRASAALEAAWLETVAIDRAAEIAAANGSSDVAAKLIGYTDAAFERFGCPRESTEQPDYERALVEIRASLSEDRLAALLATGATLDEPTALKLAMHATEMGDLK